VAQFLQSQEDIRDHFTMKSLLTFLLLLYVAGISCRLGIPKPNNGKIRSDPTPTCPLYPKPVPISASNPALTKVFVAVDTYFQQQLQKVDIPGFLVTVVYDQDIVWHNEYVSILFWKLLTS
jgi:hypothetical protein